MVRPMRLLVLGGTSFVGRAVVAEALGRGWSVTTFNRGNAPPVAEEVERLVGDRLAPADLRPLRGRAWDAVVDTWAGAPRAARDSAEALAGAVARYAYVSSGSVYGPPPQTGGDESQPTVPAAPDADDGEYAANKRGAELAIEAAFGDRALLARAGLILGPHENIGRLPWWLLRMRRGGEVLAPGPRDLPLQYIDARDLAAWLLDAVADGRSGPFNVVSRRGHATMGRLLEACRAASGAPGTTLTWVAPEFVDASGIEPWTELPVWLPPDHEYHAMHDTDVERAHAAGLRCRPLQDTVRDTWAWLRAPDGAPPPMAVRPAPGLDPAREHAALTAWQRSRGAAAFDA
jgi:nucleoside-diphosphate-sugar epimerase